MKRSGRLRRRTRLRAKPVPGYAAFKRALFAAWGGRCATCGAPAVDAHHTVKPRRAHLMDRMTVVPLCRRCHQAVDRPFARGRLCIIPWWSLDGSGHTERMSSTAPAGVPRFVWTWIFKANKWAPDPVETRWHIVGPSAERTG